MLVEGQLTDHGLLLLEHGLKGANAHTARMLTRVGAAPWSDDTIPSPGASTIPAALPLLRCVAELSADVVTVPLPAAAAGVWPGPCSRSDAAARGVTNPARRRRRRARPAGQTTSAPCAMPRGRRRRLR